MADEEGTTPGADGPPRRRTRRWVSVVVGGLLLVAALGYGTMIVRHNRIDIAYSRPAGPATPGGTVVVPATPGHECGPLFVSLHRRGLFGLWSQTHSGNVFDGFTPDARPWWSLRGGTYLTPVPCGIGRTTTFTLPDDVAPGTIAACDTDRRCTEIRVED